VWHFRHAEAMSAVLPTERSTRSIQGNPILTSPKNPFNTQIKPSLMKKVTAFLALTFIVSCILTSCGGDQHCEAYHSKVVKEKKDRSEAAI
jgi:hypothetical protein